MNSRLPELNDTNFDERVRGSDRPMLVDFWAAWCGPCRAVAPTLEELGEDYSERVAIMKLNVDDNPEAAMRYQVRAIPTLILFQNGEEKERLVGAQPKKTIADLLDRYAA